MAAEIDRLRTGRQRLRAERAAELRQLVIDFEGLDGEAARRIVAAIDRETAAEKGMTFVILSAEQNAQVVDAIHAAATRPALTARLWAKLFTRLNAQTNEIVCSRADLAAELNAPPRHVSTALHELAKLNALTFTTDGRHTRWFMNPRVASHLPGAAREAAQAGSPELNLPSNVVPLQRPTKLRSRSHVRLVPDQSTA
jgi:hypothetical protein